LDLFVFRDARAHLLRIPHGSPCGHQKAHGLIIRQRVSNKVGFSFVHISRLFIYCEQARIMNGPDQCSSFFTHVHKIRTGNDQQHQLNERYPEHQKSFIDGHL
jgi:hypothetical protein